MGKYIELDENKLIDMYKSNIYKMSDLCKYFNVSKHKIRKSLLLNSVESKSSKKYKYYDNIFEIVDNEEKAYWLGFLFADGYVRERKSSSELRLKLSIKDREHLIEFKKFISPDDLPIVNELSGNSQCVKVSVNSRKIVKDLINLGCTNNKSKTIKMPNISDTLLSHFIRGYFDGDGWIIIDKNKKPAFGIVSASIEMLISLNLSISEKSNIKESKIYDYTSYYNFSYKSYTDIIKISEFLYKQSSIYLIRKKDKFDDVLSLYQNHKNKDSKRWN
jgi:hypothetical protein